jgi:hypothetical protein
MKILDIRIKEKVQTKAKRLPMCDAFMRNIQSHHRYRHFETLKDMLLDSFKWDETPEGHDYWQGVFDLIETVELLPCPKCGQSRRICWRPRLQENHCPNCRINYV